MSAVRMCDRCGTIFPEGQEGSGVFAGSRVVTNERTGRKEAISSQMDVCGDCNGFQETVTPRIAIAKTKHDHEGETVE